MVLNVVATTSFDPLVVDLWLAFAVTGSFVALRGIGVWPLPFAGMHATGCICTTENRSALPQGTGFISAFRRPSRVVVPTVLTVEMLSINVIFQNAAALSRCRRRTPRVVFPARIVGAGRRNVGGAPPIIVA
jgi:hypothetical protein